MSLPEHKFKVVLLGDGRVGKTSLLNRYVNNSYADPSPSTVAASFLEKTVVLPQHEEAHRDTATTARLAIWDTAGQERFHSLGPIYYRDADGAVLVYDITDADSFHRVQAWVKELRRMVGDESDISVAVVGNKTDLESERVLLQKHVEDYVASVGGTHYQASAKTGNNVHRVFEGLTQRMMDNWQTRQANHANGGTANLLAGGTHKLTVLPPGERTNNHTSSSCCS